MAQVNIVTMVDAGKALLKGTLEGHLYMMDNGVKSGGQGTARLSTGCQRGQVVNWIIYPMQGPAASVRISSITFPDGDVCGELRIYGGLCDQTSPYAPVYDYWAGYVLGALAFGVYRYRLEVEIRTAAWARRLSVETPSLNVQPPSKGRGL